MSPRIESGISVFSPRPVDREILRLAVPALGALIAEPLFLLARPDLPGLPAGDTTRIDAIAHLPLVLPSGRHGLRALVNNADTLGPSRR